jgi:fumarylacetoacetase
MAGPVLDATHDPALGSWVDSANDPDSDFPLQNLPFGIFRRRGSTEALRAGVAIGSRILDLAHPAAASLLAPAVAQACREPSLNSLMALGHAASSSARHALWAGLKAGSPERERLRTALLGQDEAEMALPARIGDFTDFYSSIHHASRVGRLMRPDQPLLPNYTWLPVAYHGRASTVLAGDVPVVRPHGQIRPALDEPPRLAPTARLDYEVELGIFIGAGNDTGEPIAVDRAWDHVFGVVLLNDWSARDIQAWEYQPLGPFLAKNFATRISPWVVTVEALLPFRTAQRRPDTDPRPLPYLQDPTDGAGGMLDITLTAALQTEAMRRAGAAPAELSRSNAGDAYWTVAQMIAHHTVNGCVLRSGDLLGTGTLSGPQDGQGACLLELTRGGREPIILANGERRAFLEDGDLVELRARCRRPGAASIGFGPLRALVLPAAATVGGA